LNDTIDVGWKPDPCKVTTVLVELREMLVGEAELRTGAGFKIPNPTELDSPPPGAGLTVVIESDPVDTRSEASRLTASWLSLV
jgi:hypothetical protein